MSKEDWFRNTEWNDEIEKEFYQKLNRARYQRDQYLVIQALSLSKNCPQVTLRLVHEYFEARKSDFDYNRALQAEAEAYLSLGQIDNVVKTYKSILEREAEHPNQISGVYVDYPYLVATNEIKDEYQNVVTVLKQNREHCTFPIDHFQWHASMALIKNDKREATKALEMAGKDHSGFNYHKSLGLVGPEHKATIKKLNSIGT